MEYNEKEKYIEYEVLMESMFNRYHGERFGKDMRNDKLDIHIVYEYILEQYYRGQSQYTTFQYFLTENFEYFVIGYLYTAIEKAQQERCPLAWGVYDGRYQHYVDAGHVYVKAHPECFVLETLSSHVVGVCYFPEHCGFNKQEALQKSSVYAQQIVRIAQQQLTRAVYELLFHPDVLKYHGVEHTCRLIFTVPWEPESPLYGEWYKYVYNMIFPKLGTQLSIRLEHEVNKQ